MLCLATGEAHRLHTLCPAQHCCHFSFAADSLTNQESSVDVIRLDVSRTFPHLGIFQKVNLTLQPAVNVFVVVSSCSFYLLMLLRNVALNLR